jgi:hypothetical protein
VNRLFLRKTFRTARNDARQIASFAEVKENGGWSVCADRGLALETALIAAALPVSARKAGRVVMR